MATSSWHGQDFSHSFPLSQVALSTTLPDGLLTAYVHPALREALFHSGLHQLTMTSPQDCQNLANRSYILLSFLFVFMTRFMTGLCNHMPMGAFSPALAVHELDSGPALWVP